MQINICVCMYIVSIELLLIQMRSTNGYVWSEWSESEVIALDMNCSSTRHEDESKSSKQLLVIG